MDLEVDVNSHQASPFVDIYQAEVMFPLNFNTVKSVDEVECAFPQDIKVLSWNWMHGADEAGSLITKTVGSLAHQFLWHGLKFTVLDLAINLTTCKTLFFGRFAWQQTCMFFVTGCLLYFQIAEFISSVLWMELLPPK